MQKQSGIKLKAVLALFLLGLTWSALAQSNTPLPLIPWPKTLKMGTGTFNFEGAQVRMNQEELFREVEVVNEALSAVFGFELPITDTEKGGNIQLLLEPSAKEGQYHLEIQPSGILISGSRSGIFYGFQTLMQLLPTNGQPPLVPCLSIDDEPRFSWRGMHLDVCRHFFPASFVKKYIDLIASYKMNTFHWHLTDDQGWRIEINKYPELVKTGAWRKGTMVGPYSDHRFDTIRYGGYYTQDEVREIVDYAAKRHITIVPEIEMPGHAMAAIAAYPNLSCTGKPIDVCMEWGVLEDVFCPKEETFQFLENVLTEVMGLFPGKYIHVGGDECPKTRWKACAHCQALMKKEGLKNEHELQSYFIRRMEKFINSKGRRIIGWDEILEGGLAPNAAVMSWRGFDGGLEAAKQGHDVVMSPGSHCYFDHYQGTPAGEPLAIGGYTPLEKVYAFEPIPEGLNKKEALHILGAQANLWTEYILSTQQVEYMVLPRMCALSEVLWTPKAQKDETSFLLRLQHHFALLEKRKLNYSRSLYHIDVDVQPTGKPGEILVALKANSVLGTIHYTRDGNEPHLASATYAQPLLFSETGSLRASLFHEGEAMGSTLKRSYQINKATGRPVTLTTPPSKYYNTGGSFTLVNGFKAQVPRVNTEWLAWSGQDMEAIVDLQTAQEIQTVSVGFLKEEGSWIYLPVGVKLSVSEDGKTYTTLAEVKQEALNKNEVRMLFPVTKARYVKIYAKNAGKIPSGKSGAGEDAWLFCDEISIQ